MRTARNWSTTACAGCLVSTGSDAHCCAVPPTLTICPSRPPYFTARPSTCSGRTAPTPAVAAVRMSPGVAVFVGFWARRGGIFRIFARQRRLSQFAQLWQTHGGYLKACLPVCTVGGTHINDRKRVGGGGGSIVKHSGS